MAIAADSFSHLISYPDGDYLLGGTSQSNLSGDQAEPGRTDGGSGTYWIVKISTSGNKLWDKTFYGGSASQLRNLAETPQGGYLVGGIANGIAFHDKTEEGYGYWIVNLDATGKKKWDKLYGINKDYNWAISIDFMQAVPNGFMLGGSIQSPNFYGTDYNLLKLDASGKVDQTFVFKPIPIKMYGQPPFAVEANAYPSLPVIFSIVSGPATVKGNIVTLTGPGVVVIKATQAGNDIFNPAEVSQSFIVDDSKYVLKELVRADYGAMLPRVEGLAATPDGGALMIGDYYTFIRQLPSSKSYTRQD